MTSIVFFPHNMEVNGDQQLFGYANFSEYFMLNRRKKLDWNLRASKWWLFSFWGELSL